MPFILDCSIAMSWIFADETSDTTLKLLESLERDFAVVPQLWHLEVANVLLMAARRNRIREQDWPKLIGALDALPIEVDVETHSKALPVTLGIAAKHGISAYDGAYVELAGRRDLPLATLDRRLAETCRSLGITVADA
jgi:predicted nucleic acid-binding protein